ncbi:MAG: hypothetical protein MJZ29_10880 [Bacteroidaceae bacterium]|nr:hypothetical protein [Bacteroidaceae bacterium]
MKRQLESFDLQELERIMNELGAVPRIFNSEAQFQFELAWKIKEEFGCEVRLEDLSRISEGKKDYTDIILEKDGLRIALELKYKTAKYEDESKNIYLKAHGAADLGAYDFLWDVHRIQLLTGMETSDKDEVKRPCDKGYAIILTNDYHYWKDATIKETINRDFLIGSGEFSHGVLCKKFHQWYTLDGEVGHSKALLNDRSRQHEIDLKRNYFFQWKPYHTIDSNETNKEFKYMIVEMAPNSKTENNPEVIDSMKDAIAVEIAKHIENKYGERWIKCVDLAMSASWWNKEYTIEELATINIDELVAEVFKQIDNDEII